MPEISKTTLVSRVGGANKQYTAWIEPAGGGYMVHFQFGPVGGWVQGGVKTHDPVPLERAQGIMNRLLEDKRAKGYEDAEAAPAFVPPPPVPTVIRLAGRPHQERAVSPLVERGIAGASQYRPMLLTPDTEENLHSYISDDEWVAQEKVNGVRLILKANDRGRVVGLNRRGLERPIPQVLADVVARCNFVLDGELIGTKFYAFDALEIDGEDVRNDSFEDRIHMMMKAMRPLKRHDVITPVPTIYGSEGKRSFAEELSMRHREGIVFKKRSSRYSAGRVENLDRAVAVKVKFWSEGDFEVLQWNTRMSVEVGAREPRGPQMVSVGNVTVPAKYARQIHVGSIIRVRYLYATDNNILYQPSLDPTDAGQVVREEGWDGQITRVADLKHEGRDE